MESVVLKDMSDLLDLSTRRTTASIRVVLHDPRMTQDLCEWQAVVGLLFEEL